MSFCWYLENLPVDKTKNSLTALKIALREIRHICDLVTDYIRLII